jgi:gas vesicle protein
MNLTTERNTWVFAAGLVAGASVGATMALLAPKRGADLRNDLSRSAAKLGQTVTGTATKAAVSQISDVNAEASVSDEGAGMY